MVTMLALQQTGLVYKEKPEADTLIKLSSGKQPCRKLWVVVLQVLSEFGALSFPSSSFIPLLVNAEFLLYFWGGWEVFRFLCLVKCFGRHCFNEVV